MGSFISNRYFPLSVLPCISIGLWSFLLGLTADLHGQPRYNGADIGPSEEMPFSVVAYDMDNGLPDNRIKDMVLDNGRIIVLTDNNGLVWLDGTSVDKVTGYSELNHIPQVDDLVPLGGGIVLVGNTEKGMYMLRPFVMTLNRIIHYLGISGSVLKIKQFGDLISIFFDDDKLIQYNVQSQTIVRNVRIPSIGKNDAAELLDDILFYAVNEEVVRLDLRTGDSRKILTGAVCHTIRRSPYTREVYYIGSSSVIRIDYDGNCETMIGLNQHERAFFRDIEFMRPNEWIVGSVNGLVHFRNHEVNYYTGISGLGTDFTDKVRYMPDEDILFVGSFHKGVLKLQRNKLRQIKDDISTVSLRNHPIALGPGNHVYVIAETGIMQVMEDDYKLFCPGSMNTDRSLSYIDDQFYIGYSDSLVQVCGKTNSGVNTEKYGKELKAVVGMYKDRQGYIWVAGRYGIAVFRNGEKISFDFIKSIQGAVIGVTELRDGRVCLYGTEGVHLIKDYQTIRTIGRDYGWRGSEIRSVYEDEEGKLWLGSYGGGLYCYHHDSLRSINEMPGAMLHSDVFTLVKDDFGYLHMTSNDGMFSLREQALQDFYYHRLDHLIPFRYDHLVLNKSREFNGSTQNAVVRCGSDFYFPTINGVTRLAPSAMFGHRLQTIIRQVWVNGSRLSNDQVHLPRTSYSVRIDFGAPNFTSHNQVFYQYRLTGSRHADWSALQSTPTVTFWQLPPGKYEFQVKALDAFGDTSPSIATYRFIIDAYYYETRWFKILVICGTVFIIGLITLWRIRHNRLRIEREEMQKRILLEFELKSLHSRMSPHFIFNCLNNIKYYIQMGHYQDADKFTDHFSVLLRRFLTSSETFELTVKEEVDIIREYLELESMRLRHQFSYVIEVENSCWPVRIPSLFIQPFVENSVKHGFNTLDKDGRLSIRFCIEDDCMVCVVDDNGIGRIRSQEINQRRAMHVSSGMKILEGKAEILRERFGKNVDIEITDKYENGQSTGTTVTIRYWLPDK